MEEQHQQAQERVDFFISYRSNGKNRVWAEWIAYELEQKGYRVHFQGWDVRPGSNLVKAMDDATKRAERTVIVLSTNSLQISRKGDSRQASLKWASPI